MNIDIMNNDIINNNIIKIDNTHINNLSNILSVEIIDKDIKVLLKKSEIKYYYYSEYKTLINEFLFTFSNFEEKMPNLNKINLEFNFNNNNFIDCHSLVKNLTESVQINELFIKTELYEVIKYLNYCSLHIYDVGDQEYQANNNVFIKHVFENLPNNIDKFELTLGMTCMNYKQIGELVRCDYGFEYSRVCVVDFDKYKNWNLPMMLKELIINVDYSYNYNYMDILLDKIKLPFGLKTITINLLVSEVMCISGPVKINTIIFPFGINDVKLNSVCDIIFSDETIEYLEKNKINYSIGKSRIDFMSCVLFNRKQVKKNKKLIKYKNYKKN